MRFYTFLFTLVVALLTACQIEPMPMPDQLDASEIVSVVATPEKQGIPNFYADDEEALAKLIKEAEELGVTSFFKEAGLGTVEFTSDDTFTVDNWPANGKCPDLREAIENALKHKYWGISVAVVAMDETQNIFLTGVSLNGNVIWECSIANIPIKDLYAGGYPPKLPQFARDEWDDEVAYQYKDYSADTLGFDFSQEKPLLIHSPSDGQLETGWIIPCEEMDFDVDETVRIWWKVQTGNNVLMGMTDTENNPVSICNP